MDLANLLLDIDESRAAIACLKRLVTLRPDLGAAWQNLAVAQFLRSRFDEGIASSHEALRCDAKNIAAAFNLALALGHLKKYDEALELVRAAMLSGTKEPSVASLELRLTLLRFKSRVAKVLRRVLRLR
jgi:tetratricopeptide (TPR) repeat protein